MNGGDRLDRAHGNGSAGSRFSDRVGDYAAYRPSYPAAAVDAVLAGLPGASASIGEAKSGEAGSKEGWSGMEGVRWFGRAADVGAGTGIFSRLLAARGAVVEAIEPNALMRRAALEAGGEAADASGAGGAGGAGDGGDADAREGAVSGVGGRVVVRDGTAEATGLGDRSVGLVVCAQAFHWFDAAAAFDEFGRVLDRPGRVALVWNVRRGDGGFTSAYGELIGRHAQDGVSLAWLGGRDVAGMLRERFDDGREAVFDHSERLDLQRTLGRARSASYVPNRGWAGERFAGELSALFARHASRDGDGVERVTWSQETRVYLADLS